jgi:hypothetical protein
MDKYVSILCHGGVGGWVMVGQQIIGAPDLIVSGRSHRGQSHWIPNYLLCK